MKDLWNERFSTDEYVYGKEPNVFFKQQLDKLTPGKLLMLAEGEGRNAVYAATLGWQVNAVDLSENAKSKALKLAKENNVEINYQVSDLENFTSAPELYDAIGIFYLHLPEETNEIVSQKAISFLAPKGKIILEAFEKEQLGKSSGGPKESDLLYSLEDIVNFYNELEFDLFKKETVTLSEGRLHQGEACVVRFVGSKSE
jgi:SAM-dependent methyltransferase